MIDVEKGGTMEKLSESYLKELQTQLEEERPRFVEEVRQNPALKEALSAFLREVDPGLPELAQLDRQIQDLRQDLKSAVQAAKDLPHSDGYGPIRETAVRRVEDIRTTLRGLERLRGLVAIALVAGQLV
jgi:chromosome segregation ATPase